MDSKRQVEIAEASVIVATSDRLVLVSNGKLAMRRSLWNGKVSVPTGPAKLRKNGTGSE